MGVGYDIEIQALKKKLLFSQRRYEIVLGFSQATVFDYNVITKKIIIQPTDFEIFGMPAEIENGAEGLIALGVIAPRSYDDIRDLYQRIENGEATAKTVVYANDVHGNEIIVEIVLANIFSDQGEPIYAIGMHKDITDAQLLKKEKAYKTAVAENTILAYEANITQDRFTNVNKEWFDLIGITDISSVDEALRNVCNKAIAPEHRESVYENTSNKAIIAAYKRGQRLITQQNLKLVSTNRYEWHESTIHIIEDESTGDINVRCYNKNIHKEKEKQRKIQEEQHYYESMVSKSDALYEFNLTKNMILRGNEDWDKLYGIIKINNYSKMMEALCEKAIHPHDREKFRTLFFRENVLNTYAQGIGEIVCEYRRPNIHGEFIWVRCILHMFEDPDSGDLKGYSYVHSIDEEKKEQLELIYKSQRDSLTGLYNKATLEEKISEFIATSDALVGKHAFFILDLDYFKKVNDNFGHAFGDVFLSQTASKISSLFREGDILGRIGGDEFVVFMKNVQSDKAICAKAAELCAALSETYKQNEVMYPVSVSIGIAVYYEHGKSYDDLYHNSDTALYYAKEHGRNQYAIYENTMQFGATNIKAIDSVRQLQAKIFNENISEYVFRILYESSDKEVAINSVLELIGKHYEASRVYIFENSDDGKYTKNTFEWCNQGVLSQMDKLQKLSYTPLGDYEKNFNEDGYFFMPDIEKATPALQKILAPQGVKSMLQFSIIKNGEFFAFLGFDQCDHLRNAKQNELSECRNMANVIGIFITEMRAIERAMLAKLESDVSKQMVLSVMNGLGSYAYVCDHNTHEILFINERLQELTPDAKVGDICYQAFWANDSVCENCPMNTLAQGADSRFTTEMFNTNLKIWVKVTTSWIDWLEEGRACLVDSVDITKYMKS